MAGQWEKMHVDYFNLKWLEPSSERSYTNLLSLIKFFLAHCDTSNHRISFKLFLLSKETVQEFNEQNVNFKPQLEISVKSLLHILYVLGIAKRMGDQQLTETNLAIDAKEGLTENLQRFANSFTPPKTDQGLGSYGLFTDYLTCQYRIIRFLYDLVPSSQDLVSSYQILNEMVNELPLVGNQIFLASITRAQGLEKAQDVSNNLTSFMNKLEIYFKIRRKHGIEESKPEALKINLELFLPSVVVAEPGSLVEMCTHSKSGTLISYCILTRPLCLSDWAEVATVQAAIKTFFDKIQSSKADPLASSLKRLPSIKEDVMSLQARVVSITADDNVPSSEEVTCMMGEVDDTIAQLAKLFTDGVTIDASTVGVDSKQVCYTWKKMLLVKRSECQKSEKKNDEIASKISDRAEKFVKNEVLPMCNRGTWGTFLITWKKFEKSFLDDESRGLALKAKLSDKSDQINCKNMSYNETLEYLTSRYGSFQAVFAENLDQLQDT